MILNPIALVLFSLATIPLASTTQSKYESCAQTEDCKEYAGPLVDCGVGDVDLTTPVFVPKSELQCLCQSSGFVDAIMACLTCVGYDDLPWYSACNPSRNTTASPNATSTDGNLSNLFHPKPPLGDNESWDPQNTAIIIGVSFGVIITVALVSIGICVFKKRQNRRKAVAETKPPSYNDEVDLERHGSVGYGLGIVSPILSPKTDWRMKPEDEDPPENEGRLEPEGRPHHKRRSNHEGRSRRHDGRPHKSRRAHRGEREPSTSRNRGDSHLPPQSPPDVYYRHSDGNLHQPYASRRGNYPLDPSVI